MKKIYLHVGLHKTATTFLQKNVFTKLDSKILYNPHYLSNLHNLCYKIPSKREDNIKQFRNELKKINEENDLLLSFEIMSGDLFSAYSNYKENIHITKQLFEGYEVELILVLRYQVDWLLSTYRESIHEHHYQTIEEFFELKNQNISPLEHNEYAKCNPYALDFYSIINEYYQNFGKDHVSVLYFEDFKNDKLRFMKELENVLNCKFSTYTYKQEITNRGYSSNGIFIILFIVNFLKTIKLSYLVPDPIYFFGSKSIYLKEYENNYLLSFNGFLEKESSLKLPLWFFSKVKYKFFNRGKLFRWLIKKVIDKISYKDQRVISENLQIKLDNYYKLKNIELLKLIANNLPLNYLKNKDK